MSTADRAQYVVSPLRNDDARVNCVLLRRRKGSLVLNQRHDPCVQFEMPSGLVVLHRISLDTGGVTKQYSVRTEKVGIGRDVTEEDGCPAIPSLAETLWLVAYGGRGQTNVL